MHGNILVRTWDSPSNDRPNANATCMAASATGLGFEGIHIWNIADPAQPGLCPQAADGRDRQRPGRPGGRLRGAHGATGVPDDARGNLYLYVGGSSGTCTGMDIVRIATLTNPSDAVFLRRAGRREPVVP